MPPLAWRNLAHDRIRFAVTLTGITFAVVLVTIQLGLFIGFSNTTSNLINNVGADLWVTSPHVPYIELGVRFSERKLTQIRGLPGVEDAQDLVVSFAQWKRNNGARESVQIVGFNPDSSLGRPWNIVQGQVSDFKTPDAVFVDQLYASKLGVNAVDETFEISDHRVRVGGFTRGIRSFTTSPYVFCSLKLAGKLTHIQDETTYVLVKLVPGRSTEEERRLISDNITGVEVLTTQEFSTRTRLYWMLTTGAGIAVLAAAVLGLVVGFVVVAQTIYATTVDHLVEFGTLKAMGARNTYIYKLIAKQAIISAALGYSIGMPISFLLVRLSRNSGAALQISALTSIAVLCLTILMCVGAAFVSVNKITRLDPALVFRA